VRNDHFDWKNMQPVYSAPAPEDDTE
jgi:hypothetical protein